MFRKIIATLVLISFVLFNTDILVFAQAQSAASSAPANAVLSKLISSSGKMIPDIETNSVMVVDYPSNIANIEEYLKMADTPSQQVIIEAKIVEVQLNKENQSGVNWNVVAQGAFNQYGNSIIDNKHSGNILNNVQSSPPTSVTSNPSTVTTYDSSGNPVLNYVNAPLITTQAANVGGLLNFQPITNQLTDPLSLGVFSSGVSIDAVLKLLSTQVKTNVLSAPQVTTTNNRRAKIDVVRTTPYVARIDVTPPTTTGSTTTSSLLSYTYATADEGVSMDVTPLINKDSSITLSLYPQVKEIVQMMTLPGANGSTVSQPQIDTRSMQTKVTVQSGQTLVIGGLIRETSSNSTTKLPVLGDLPFIGKLFSSKDVTKQKTELLIFVSPKIVNAAIIAGMSKKSVELARNDVESDTPKKAASVAKKPAPTSVVVSASVPDEQDWSHIIARLDSLQTKMQDVTDNRESLQKEIEKAQ